MVEGSSRQELTGNRYRWKVDPVLPSGCAVPHHADNDVSMANPPYNYDPFCGTGGTGITLLAQHEIRHEPHWKILICGLDCFRVTVQG